MSIDVTHVLAERVDAVAFRRVAVGDGQVAVPTVCHGGRCEDIAVTVVRVPVASLKAANR